VLVLLALSCGFFGLFFALAADACTGDDPGCGSTILPGIFLNGVLQLVLVGVGVAALAVRRWSFGLRLTVLLVSVVATVVVLIASGLLVAASTST
jgi:hypothetical protein